MDAAAASAADLETAFAALASAGYVADLVVGSQDALSPALYVDGLLVASSSGIVAAIQERAAAPDGTVEPGEGRRAADRRLRPLSRSGRPRYGSRSARS